MKKVFGIIAVVMFLAVATVALAVGPGPGAGGPGIGPKGYGQGAGINLSKEQMDKMWQLREKFNNDTSPLRYELFQKRGELRALYADPKATDSAIFAKEKEVNTLRQKMHDKMVQFKLDQRKVYTADQLKTLSERGYGRGFGGGYGRGFGRSSGRGYGSGPCGRF